MPPSLGAESGQTEEAMRHAREAVAEAQSAVQSAAGKRALWTTAVDALDEAQAALTRNDAVAAEEHARYAAEQAQLGIAQLGYPHFR